MNAVESKNNNTNGLRLSLCITTYNRPELTIEAFEQVYTDNRISEIVILDDCSEQHNYEALRVGCGNLVDRMGINKIVLGRNLQNVGMSLNKRNVIELATNEWCILFDSDNVIDSEYVDAFYNILETPQDRPVDNIIYCPTWAKPDFDYRSLSGKAFTAKMIGYQIKENNILNMAMNTCNYIVNRKQYLDTYVKNDTHKASDTIWFNYNWLKAGNYFYFVQNMHYYHRVHNGSGFIQDVTYNSAQAEKVRKLISKL